jgi:hypothetical protein
LTLPRKVPRCSHHTVLLDLLSLPYPRLPDCIAVSHASYLHNTVLTHRVHLILIDHFRVSSRLSTGYGPRAIDDFSRQPPLFLRPHSYYLITVSRPCGFSSYTVYSSAIDLARRFPSARYSQETRNPIAFRRPANRNPSQLTSGHPLHLYLLSYDAVIRRYQSINCPTLQPLLYFCRANHDSARS